MGSQEKRVKNAAAKAVRRISEDHPQLLLPYIGYFRDLLDQEDSILKWIATDVIGNLSSLDIKGIADTATLGLLFDMLSDDSIVTASHSISALGKVAQNSDKHREEITQQLARVERISRNPECRNILLGKVIDAYSLYYLESSESSREKIISLAKRQLKNPRPATKRRADALVSQFKNS
jgi:hypothetical protein